MPGEITTFGAYEVTRDDVIAFASEFDPQPFHLDEERDAPRCWRARSLRLAYLLDPDAHDVRPLHGWIDLSGVPGHRRGEVLRPVFPGDVLSVRREILDARPSSSKPDRGVVRFRFQLLNQKARS